MHSPFFSLVNAARDRLSSAENQGVHALVEADLTHRPCTMNGKGEKMKRFKKLTIYILVGVLASSSVMLSYKKAETAYASATLTLGTGALLMIGLLGAYGIVYKGATDTVNGNYIWESALPKYEDDINELEQRFKVVWDSSVNQVASGGGYDPNDDWDGDEDKPPTWDNLVDFFNANNSKQFKLGATVMGALLAGISYGLYQDISNPKKGVLLNSGEIVEFGYNLSGVSNLGYKYRFEVGNCDDLRMIPVKWSNSSDPNNYTYAYVFASKNSYTLKYGSSFSQYYDVVGHWSNLTVSSLNNCSIRNLGVDGVTIKTYFYGVSHSVSYTVYNESIPFVTIPYNLNDTELYRQFLREIYSDEYTYDSLLNENSVGISSEIKIDGDNGTLEPILPVIQIPSNGTVGDLLGNLVISTGNQAQTQLAVDQFIDSLQGSETNPEGGVVPNPTPTPDPNPEPNPNPDDGEEGGEGSSDDKDNSTLLADLKNVFPFCIPFDLINCFRLFNAEPVTPRVEVPLHFGIIDTDYTFVIDLEDFNGVAQVCRSMFLIMFIVGLVLSTRTLIRG